MAEKPVTLEEFRTILSFDQADRVRVVVEDGVKILELAKGDEIVKRYSVSEMVARVLQMRKETRLQS